MSCCETIFVGDVIKYHEAKKGHARRTLYLNEGRLFYDPTRRNKTFLLCKCTYACFNEANNILEFHFLSNKSRRRDLRCRFSLKDPEKSLRMIVNFLNRFYNTCEKKSIMLESFKVNPEKATNPRSVLSRFKSYSYGSKDIHITEGLNFLSRYLKVQAGCIVLQNNIGSPHIVDSIIYALQNYQYGKSLVIPEIKNYNFYTSFLRMPSHALPFEYLSIAGSPTKKGLEFFMEAPLWLDFEVSSMSFVDSRFNGTDLDRLEEFLSDKEIISLGMLSNSIEKNDVSLFSRKVLTPRVLKNLKYLMFKDQPRLYVEDLAPYLVNIRVLSLNELIESLDVVISELSKIPLPSLKALDLSFNRMENAVDSSLRLPKQLIRLDVSVIRWSSGTFASFMKFLTKQEFEKPINFYMSSCDISESEVSSAFRYATGKMKFRKFFWNGCPVVGEIFGFLKACELDTLSMSSSLCYSNIKHLDDLISLLKGNKHLRKLLLCGSELKKIGSRVTQVIKTFRSLKQLEYLNLYGQNLVGSDFKLLAEVAAKNKKLRYMNVDCCNAPNIECISEIIKAFMRRNSNEKIVFSYPYNTIEGFKSDRKIHSGTIDKIIEDICTLAKQNLETFNKNDPMSVRFDAPTFPQNDAFPMFLNDYLRREIDELPELADDRRDRKVRKPSVLSASQTVEYDYFNGDEFTSRSSAPLLFGIEEIPKTRKHNDVSEDISIELALNKKDLGLDITSPSVEKKSAKEECLNTHIIDLRRQPHNEDDRDCKPLDNPGEVQSLLMDGEKEEKLLYKDDVVLSIANSIVSNQENYDVDPFSNSDTDNALLSFSDIEEDQDWGPLEGPDEVKSLSKGVEDENKLLYKDDIVLSVVNSPASDNESDELSLTGYSVFDVSPKKVSNGEPELNSSGSSDNTEQIDKWDQFFDGYRSFDTRSAMGKLDSKFSFNNLVVKLVRN